MNDAMRAIEISAPGGPEVLRLVERPTPSPGPGEVLIKVDAAGVNRPDVLQRMGLYPPPPGASDLPGLEVAGSIAAIGAPAPDAPKEPALRVGQAVCALLPGGGYADYAIAPAGSCLRIPGNLSPEEAAGLPETVFTVWANVFEAGALKKGERLLVHGGTSGIGSTAIALAKARGAHVTATASTTEKCEQILSLGADTALNYNDEGWEKTISENGGADVVLDMTGGDFVARNLKSLNPGGRHVSIAFLRGAKAEINVMEIMRKQLVLTGSTMKARSIAEKARLAGEITREVWPLYESGAVVPAIDRIYALKDAAEAHQRMEAGLHTGKIILSMHQD